MNAPANIQTMKTAGNAVQPMPDLAVDMFTERGFALANRIAKAYASSDAVPAQFRAYNLKKAGTEENWVENPSAIGNCLVAIEVARAVDMSITAVMQNADMIEGKLRWSGKFVIAAINASGRFTPLRFQMINRGRINATYKEKTGWNKEARRPIFEERSVEVDDVECIAWALPKGFPEPQLTPDLLRKFPNRKLDMYKALGLPVVESAPVTMKMAVEEGWYGKSGSKWQTEMRVLMFQYRAGSFFGNIHAPDIVMGMGRTSEEERDIIDINPDGSYVVPTMSVDDLRANATQATARAEPADVVGEQAPQHAAAADDGQQPGLDIDGNDDAGHDGDAPTFKDINRELLTASTVEELDLARSMISGLADEAHKATLNQVAARRVRELTQAAEEPSTAAPAGRRARAPLNAE
ncbi:hypothetical protein U875_14230 [Pandoraea pnomenusa 3kgm]|uniref:hypothetical protein n=1 Tax=Pandoraea pnomenusa TaxID=93220 RepID=UPI0003C7464D|nr:hypothetical protein [Pandoraea pnomenusa]AHB06373.1 hypothetical protein U875_14230 [Pandoraea pnomenusa 3kgm]